MTLSAKKIQSLKDRYSGQRCFIMGNGPSINLMDLDLLANEIVWGFNKCYLLYDRLNWRPRFYVTNDQRLAQDIGPEINQLVQQSNNTTFFFPKQFKKQGILFSSSKINWFNEKKLKNEEITQWSFSKDVSSWVANSATVTIAGLQLASYLGFSPIFLIGCDTTYSIPKSVLIDGSPENLISTQNDDPNHFSSNYFSQGDKWVLPNTELMIQQYEQSKIMLDDIGVFVYNANVGGNLEVFQRVNFNNLFDKNIT